MRNLTQKIPTLYRSPSLAARQVDFVLPNSNHALIVLFIQIEQWNEHHYPSFILVVPDKSGSKPMLNTSDARVRILELENHLEAELSKKKRIEDVRAGIANGVPSSSNGGFFSRCWTIYQRRNLFSH